MARKTSKSAASVSGDVRIKLLGSDLPEGALEAVVRVPGARADELIAAKLARRARLEDFVFEKS